MKPSSKLRKLTQTPQGESWTPLTRRLMGSPAWRCMTGMDRKVLDRLLLEHMHHSGLWNGTLKCTYDDFEKYGVRRNSIRESINRLSALGLIKRTRVGRRGYGEAKGEAAEYALTFYRTRTEGNNPAEATDDWMRFETMDAAQKAVGSMVKRRTRKPPKTHFPRSQNATVSSDKTLLGSRGTPSDKTLLNPSNQSATPLYTSGPSALAEPWSERELAYIDKRLAFYLTCSLDDIKFTIAAGVEAGLNTTDLTQRRKIERELVALRSALHHVKTRKRTTEANHGSDSPRVPGSAA